MNTERLNIQSGPFKGKPQQWFTRAEVLALLAGEHQVGGAICNPHPDAPHGFNRNASHNAGFYVCDCEGWTPPAI